VEIRRRRSGERGFAEYVEVPVTPGGRWSARISATIGASYVAGPQTHRCAVARSAPIDVGVVPRIQILSGPSCGAGAGVSGRVLGRAAGARLLLERRAGRRWKTVAVTRLADGAAFSFALPRCAPARYRLRAPADGRLRPAGRRGFAL
jgi:hypothetical protein